MPDSIFKIVEGEVRIVDSNGNSATLTGIDGNILQVQPTSTNLLLIEIRDLLKEAVLYLRGMSDDTLDEDDIDELDGEC